MSGLTEAGPEGAPPKQKSSFATTDAHTKGASVAQALAMGQLGDAEPDWSLASINLNLPRIGASPLAPKITFVPGQMA